MGKIISRKQDKLKYYIDLVGNSKDVIVVPRSDEDEDSVVIMSMKEYKSLTETEYLLASDSNRERLERARKRVEATEILEALHKPMRDKLDIEQLKKEQNFKPIDKAELFQKIDELNIEEPLEDLLAMI